MRISNKIFLLIALIFFIAIFSSCSIKQTPQGKSANVPTNSQLTLPPAEVIVFTYNADCCEGTRILFETHRDSVKELENKYGQRVKFTWYDIAVEDKDYQESMMNMAKKFNVDRIPALVVTDIESRVLVKQTGQLQMEEINRIFKELDK
ncbi:MAG: hypothetical protein XD84_2118 [Desulfotomaculum sp. 46_80]|nr:MAG: hypothetical protein XD84_2118 [Desulfotomaculum sp. 46_80]